MNKQNHSAATASLLLLRTDGNKTEIINLIINLLMGLIQILKTTNIRCLSTAERKHLDELIRKASSDPGCSWTQQRSQETESNLCWTMSLNPCMEVLQNWSRLLLPEGPNKDGWNHNKISNWVLTPRKIFVTWYHGDISLFMWKNHPEFKLNKTKVMQTACF